MSPSWQIALSMSSNIGLIIGVFANGFLVPIFGYKRIMIFCYVSMTCFIFITFFAPNVEVLFVGELLCGAPWGIFSALAPAYASEVCPTALRVYLITFVNLCWVVGGWIGSGVLLGLVGNSTQWAYRIPICCSMGLACTFMLYCFLRTRVALVVGSSRAVAGS